MSTTVELVRANERYARLRDAVEQLADEMDARSLSDRLDMVAASGREADYWEGCADTISDAAYDLRALLAAVDS